MPDARICVVGGGAAGAAAALRAAALGAEVVLVERDDLGGAWANRGCVPLRALAAACANPHALPGWPEARDAARAAAAAVRAGLDARLAAAGVSVLAGDARVRGPQLVEVDTGENRFEVHAPTLVLAPGAEPARPAMLDFHDPRIVDASQLLALADLPDRALVTGGGAVALGVAGLLAAMGLRVTLAVPGPTPLADEEPQAVAALVAAMAGDGVEVLTGAEVRSAEPADGALRVTLADGSSHRADLVVAAAGRVPATADLDAGAAGAELDADGFIAVDEHLRLGEGEVYAAGDALRGGAMSHLARAQGERAVEHALGAAGRRDLGTVPRVVRGRDTLAAIGLTAARATGLGRSVDVVAADPGLTAVALGGRPALVCLVVERASGLVVGATAVGEGAAELMSGIALPVGWGCTVAELGSLVAPGPGLADALCSAADLGAG